MSSKHPHSCCCWWQVIKPFRLPDKQLLLFSHAASTWNRSEWGQCEDAVNNLLHKRERCKEWVQNSSWCYLRRDQDRDANRDGVWVCVDVKKAQECAHSRCTGPVWLVLGMHAVDYTSSTLTTRLSKTEKSVGGFCSTCKYPLLSVSIRNISLLSYWSLF